MSGAPCPLERDRKLLEAWKGGDGEAGMNLLEHYERLFHAFCANEGIPADAREDFYQEVVAYLLRRLPTLEIHRSFGGFYRNALRGLRKSLRSKDRHLDPVDENVPAKEVHLDVLDCWEAFSACLEGLSKRESYVVNARLFEGMSFEEISREIKMVSRRLYLVFFRARKRLALCMSGKGFGISWLS